MKIVITSATEFEWKGIKAALNPDFTSNGAPLQVSFHTSGVGLLASTYSLTKLVYETKPDLIIQVGIAGCFHHTVELGTVVAVKDEFLGDTGVEENEEFKDIFALKLSNENEFPFKEKKLTNIRLPAINYLKIAEVTSITINEVTTRGKRIEQLRRQYNPSIESMEGAALHYVCLQAQVPFIQIRAISNYIGERDKTNWKIKSALENLKATVVSYVDELFEKGID